MRSKYSSFVFFLVGFFLLVGALWLLKETRLIQMVLDNFFSNLVLQEVVESSDGQGGMILGTFVDWRPVKQLFLAFSFFLVFAVTLICYFIYRYVSRKKNCKDRRRNSALFLSIGSKFDGQPSDRS
ncbi:predicted protein [Enterococcus casseliflavus EC30]|nr:predicted protein [Enterococcus casseliflavus EC30]